MTSSSSGEIESLLDRAQQSIHAAQELLRGGYYDFAASRAYYAAFYAAAAALVSQKLTYAKHSGVVSAVHRNFVKTGKLESQQGWNLSWLFQLRNVADYGVAKHVSQQDAERAIAAAEQFLNAVTELI